jgi:hypothetical protein
VQGVVTNSPIVKNEWAKLVVQLSEENWAKVQHVYRTLPPIKGTTDQHRHARSTLKKQINKRQVVIVGTRLQGVEKGDTFVFNGRWEYHDIHGFQLKADDVEEVPVSTQEGEQPCTSAPSQMSEDVQMFEDVKSPHVLMSEDISCRFQRWHCHRWHKDAGMHPRCDTTDTVIDSLWCMQPCSPSSSP